jgi:voltage-gated potassium channel
MPPSQRGFSGDRVARVVLRKPLTARRAGWSIGAFTTVVTVVAGVTVWLLDNDEFPTLGGALWWAVQTVTTVGYGDIVPEDTLGRAVASLVMITGIGFLTVVTATVTAAFVDAARQRRRPEALDPKGPRMEELVARLERIEKAIQDLSASRGRGS